MARANLDAAFGDSIPRSKKTWSTKSIWPLPQLLRFKASAFLWQHIVAVRFCLDPQESEATIHGSPPSITVLKPLKGCDGETRANLTSWLTQDYPGAVSIFGVSSSNDPAFLAA